MDKPIHIRVLDWYIKAPVLYDIGIAALVSAICFVLNWKHIFPPVKLDNDFVNDAISDLNSAAISLAGFVVTALTIIIAFRDNIKARLNEQQYNGYQRNGIEIFLTNNKFYGSTVKVFFWAAIVLVVCFIALAFTRIFLDNIEKKFYPYILLVATTIISLTITRSLLVLYTILDLQINSERNTQRV